MVCRRAGVQGAARRVTSALLLFAIVFGVNLLPAFGPPTWSIIVIYGLNSHLPVAVLVVVAALAAALGRFLLAHGFRLLRSRVPARMKRNLEAAGKAIERRKRHSFLALGLFALSPVPSAQRFEAAGLTGVRLLPVTAAYFVGRLVSYSIYAATAKGIQGTTLAATFRHSLTSPVGIAVQVGMIVLLVLLAQVDWEQRLGSEANNTC